VSRLHGGARFRQRLSGVDRIGAVVNWTLIGLIVVILAATVLESVPRLAAQYGEAFEAIEYAALITFSIEYAARLWTAIEHPRWRRFGAIRSRLRFAAMRRVDRSRRGAAVLAVVNRSGRFQGLPGLAPDTLLQADALFTRHALAAGSAHTERRALVGCFVILCGATLQR
jgi:voltage-gated potassium channel